MLYTYSLKYFDFPINLNRKRYFVNTVAGLYLREYTWVKSRKAGSVVEELMHAVQEFLAFILGVCHTSIEFW